MRVASESLFIDGPAGPLETVVDLPPSSATAFAIICHPHSLHGGTLTNKVVVTVARALNDCGMPTLRFNFRGVGRSVGRYDEGRGETDDALAVLRFAQRRWPGASAAWLGGFSFGSYVALRVAALPEIELAALITVAPPIGRWDFGGLATPRCPWLIVHGTQDELVDLAAVEAWQRALAPPGRISDARVAQAGPARPPGELVAIQQATHFFHGRLPQLRETVRAFHERVRQAAA